MMSILLQDSSMPFQKDFATCISMQQHVLHTIRIIDSQNCSLSTPVCMPICGRPTLKNIVLGGVGSITMILMEVELGGLGNYFKS
ncbi:NEDD8-activating enzyme E1 regulatory subunit-like [Pyrus ussuriensis x Pyrus communis]|uniref:NEDD8-activating enzyme E1 regulatory subunit-like n=1 Tax=Pyrus ussuriensis x Pyrus communis TaxID=2448454 RepID=A0A5N5GEL8_9ROSA|nr:NEDD8-activating enzyme E1 regulatory subunit-like [Pyrus ussuriensis x Pyrus communis]